MSEQHKAAQGFETTAPSAASEAPLNGDAYAQEASNGELEKPTVRQEHPDANNDSIAAQSSDAKNDEAQKSVGDSAQSTHAAEKKKKFSWFRKDKKKLDGNATTSKNGSDAVGNSAGDDPLSGNDSLKASKTEGSADPKTAEDGDGTNQKKPKWWKLKLCPDRHRQPAVNTEHPEAAS